MCILERNPMLPRTGANTIPNDKFSIGFVPKTYDAYI